MKRAKRTEMDWKWRTKRSSLLKIMIKIQNTKILKRSTNKFFKNFKSPRQNWTQTRQLWNGKWIILKPKLKNSINRPYESTKLQKISASKRKFISRRLMYWMQRREKQQIIWRKKKLNCTGKSLKLETYRKLNRYLRTEHTRWKLVLNQRNSL